MTHGTGEDWIYVVTDIETDGPLPGPHSMRSFASVAVGLDGTEHGRFEAVLEPLPDAAPDPRTLEWFATVPGAWEAATTDPQPVPDVMARFVAWVGTLPGPTAFAASPLAFDGFWFDHYLRRFTRHALVAGVPEEVRLFDGPALCIRSYAAAVTGRPVADLTAGSLPAAWFGDVPHTHRAIDDAVGYAHLLVELARQVRGRTAPRRDRWGVASPTRTVGATDGAVGTFVPLPRYSASPGRPMTTAPDRTRRGC